MINPLEESKQVEAMVSRGTSRKYSNIEVTDFYGGSARAYCVGCNLPSKAEDGKFMTAKNVAKKLEETARSNSLSCCSIGGGEPTLAWNHLIRVLGEMSSSRLNIIIETNGIILGSDECYAKQLSRYMEFLHVKVIFSGSSPEEFAKMTGADAKFFEYQIQAMKNLLKFGVPCNPAVKTSKPDSLERLRDRLETISPSFYDIEEETP